MEKTAKTIFFLFYVAVSEKPLRILSNKSNNESGTYGRRIWPQLQGCTWLSGKASPLQ